jgi:hypothetical protein
MHHLLTKIEIKATHKRPPDEIKAVFSGLYNRYLSATESILTTSDGVSGRARPRVKWSHQLPEGQDFDPLRPPLSPSVGTGYL